MCVMNIDDCCVSNRLGCMFFFTESSVFEHIYRRDTIRERERASERLNEKVEENAHLIYVVVEKLLVS